MTFLLLKTEVTLASFFDSSGRLSQVENANKAAMRGGTVIGAHSDDYSIILTWSRHIDAAMEAPSKIHRVADFMGISSAGVVSDVNILHDKIFDDVIESSFIFGGPSPAIRIATRVADLMHGRTLSAMHRPFGVRICFISYDEVSKARVFEIDSMGNLHRCKLSFIGQ
jgi:20S proteasome alpha/beta subunit